MVTTEWHMPDVVLIRFFWWWARGCSKHVEYKSKHIWKRIVCQVGYLQECSWHSYWTALLLKMGPIGCPLVTSYQSMPLKIPEELRSHWQFSRSLKIMQNNNTFGNWMFVFMWKCEVVSTDCLPHPHTSGREHTVPKTCSSLIMGQQATAETSQS